MQLISTFVWEDDIHGRPKLNYRNEGVYLNSIVGLKRRMGGRPYKIHRTRKYLSRS
ncbi:hypothetical protein pVco7_gp041 [Vibrio phage pVco-7]|uniref:Uncharacterized protein n=1 Tax=Vibrio phage pVco-5 TaxID=1965485 RepID=A0A1W6JUU6_9CAUD|nr:hypothetical protein KNT61_gp042 [Vibrio phage pVco-5]ARM71030.1 hypothetical protein pVco5_042 [Vibrio phage pVco-5]